MKVSYEFTEKEKELLTLFKQKVALSAYDNFSGWRNSEEFNTLSRHNLIHHSNHEDHNSYIKYELTHLGWDALKFV